MLKKLLNIFFPELCLGCTKLLLEDEKLICIDCRHNIPLTNHHLNPNNEAFKKFYGRIALEYASSMLYYHKKGITQELIHNLKYKNQQELGRLLGEWYVENLINIPALNDINYIIPVPLHKKRLKERGYNQVDSFCNALSKTLNIPVRRDVLFRNEYAITQSKKGLEERNFVSKNTFDSHSSEELFNKHFLLIDDVLTTGATLEACSNALLKIPGAKISIVTMAYAHS